MSELFPSVAVSEGSRTLGPQPINLEAEFFGSAVHPAGASTWGMRLEIVFLFPKLSPKEKRMEIEKELKKVEEQEKAPEKK